MANKLSFNVGILGLLLGSGLGLAIALPAGAKTLVTCGPHGAAKIVDVVPAGCRVLSSASPPKQAGNEVQSSRLGFTFTATKSAATQVVFAMTPSSR
jgi:hypothetical protein